MAASLTVSFSYGVALEALPCASQYEHIKTRFSRAGKLTGGLSGILGFGLQHNQLLILLCFASLGVRDDMRSSYWYYLSFSWRPVRYSFVCRLDRAVKIMVTERYPYEHYFILAGFVSNESFGGITDDLAYYKTMLAWLYNRVVGKNHRRTYHAVIFRYLLFSQIIFPIEKICS